MPLTPFQIDVMSVIAKNRRPESHLAGGAVLNRDDKSIRYSDDFDIFQDPEASVSTIAEFDAESLRNAGYEFRWLVKAADRSKGEASAGGQTVRLDWVIDSDFRFFPVQPDPLFGYCLHRADLATNKVMAMAERVAARDYLDVLHLVSNYLSLGALVWAASGKDGGLTPDMILSGMKRHSRYQPSDFLTERLTSPVDLVAMKIQWLAAVDQAAALFDNLPDEDVGCLYLDADEQPVTPDPKSGAFPRLTRHFGSRRGAWPTIPGVTPEI